jgi:hypothetical protein
MYAKCILIKSDLSELDKGSCEKEFAALKTCFRKVSTLISLYMAQFINSLLHTLTLTRFVEVENGEQSLNTAGILVNITIVSLNDKYLALWRIEWFTQINSLKFLNTHSKNTFHVHIDQN